MKNIEREFTINPLIRLRWNKNGEGSLILENPEKQKKYEISENVLPIFTLNKPFFSLKDIENAFEVSGDSKVTEYHKLVEKLYEIGILTKRDKKNSYQNWIEKGWRNALYYHLLSQNIQYEDIGTNSISKKLDKLSEYLKKSRPEDPFRKYQRVKKLPKPSTSQSTFYSALFNRRTTRLFKQKGVSIKNLSTMLYFAMYPVKKIREGIIKNKSNPLGYTLSRFTACEVFIFIQNINGIKDGIYGYDIQKHGLSFISEASREDIQKAAIGQKPPFSANVTFFITTRPGNYMWRYRYPKAYQKMLADASALGHRIILAGESIGIKSFMTPALKDTFVDNLLKLDGFEESTTYLVSSGFPLTSDLNAQIRGKA